MVKNEIFIKYLLDTRTKSIKDLTILFSRYMTPNERVAFENLLIAYEQMLKILDGTT
jgi:hypothetical protein